MEKYTHIETYIDMPLYRVNIVENENGLRLFQLEKFEDKKDGYFYSTRIEVINIEIEKYLAYEFRVNGVD